LHDVSDGDSLIQWATRQALATHDAAWSRTVELPLYPVMPSVRTEAAAPASPQCDGNPVFVSRNIAEAEPGDLFVYRNTEYTAHTMVFIGKSQIIPSSSQWVIYFSAGRVHKVTLGKLAADPTPAWRPESDNPEFMGVWRLHILADSYSQ